MAGRNATPTKSGDQRRDHVSGRTLEALRAKAQSEELVHDARATGGPDLASQSADTPATGRLPAKRSRFGKLPYWAAVPVEMMVGLVVLIAAALILLVVLSQGSSWR